MNSNIEMGHFGVKRQTTVAVDMVRPPTSNNKRLDVGQNYTHSTGSSGHRKLDRKFDSLSILALSVTLLASWEGVASSFSTSLVNGGPSSLVWGMLLSLTGTMALALSLAEMASICPIAGAQYHWTALFAPPRIRPFITWFQGWATVFAWQAAATSIFFLIAGQIQGMVILNNPTYVPARWHSTLIMWALTGFSFAVNVWGIQLLPSIQLLGGIFHIVFFIALSVPLVLLANRSTPEFVFKTMMNNGGWSNDGISWCLGMLTVTYCFLGFDGAIHMSEEVRNPAKVVPRILVQSIAINGTLAFGFILILLFFIGDLNAAVHTSTGFPSIEIFYSATKSVKAATVMQCGITLIGILSSIGIVASVSRLTWAFARDGGLPFSKFFVHIDGRFHVPFRSIGLVCAVVVLISLINIGSTTALSAILALTTCSLYLSYIIPIILLVVRRFSQSSGGEPVRFGPWTMGRYGLGVNLYAILFGIFIIVFVPFPTQMPVTAENMNYAGPVFGVMALLLLIDWFMRGRKGFQGPLKELLARNT
ncbi:putative amino acid permease [Talaromyces proteolyticus]|uniref:Amino acid permease n=1 Tax=Talaromyces proteolyticus TaxID=1131652 RepID=A0AAD4KYD8_9EURO|nr:putative amino acid permease [Talaromyces proteolyticus]KAH8700110.1 putative amino acid permease [Talaromyces proteolyticus]